MRFTKMEGLGNDYIYLNCLEETPADLPGLACRLSDRHFGVGADGLICIKPGRTGDFTMEMYNADGSRGAMCGNGIRCVGKYVFDKKLTRKQCLTIDTDAGPRELRLLVKGDRAVRASVNMGKPEVSPPREVRLEGSFFPVQLVSVGNPHAVIFCEEIDSLDLPVIGPLFEHHERFPEGVNTEFIQLIDRETLRMRVWERGSGETFACGTGACASVVAAVLNGHCDPDREITVHLRGGDLKITCTSDFTVRMRGPATHVFDGEIELDL